MHIDLVSYSWWSILQKWDELQSFDVDIHFIFIYFHLIYSWLKITHLHKKIFV